MPPRRHPGRTLVFVNAISAVRRLSAILKILGLPVHTLHAQQQQRQRLKVGAPGDEADWPNCCTTAAQLLRVNEIGMRCS